MNNLVTQVVIGLIITVVGGLVLYWLGIGGGKTSVVQVQGVKTKKTGKWIIIVSFVIMFWGVKIFVDNSSPGNEINLDSMYGLGVLGLGIMLFIVGKIITWFQKI